MMITSKIDTDFISNLPEEIIHDILSRLTVLNLARTRCLSKTWKSFGDSFPYLIIDPQEFDLPLSRFKDFVALKVNNIMSISKEHLVMFEFKCLDHAQVPNTCITRNANTLNVLRLSGLTLVQPFSWFLTSCPMIREIRLVDIHSLEHLKVSGLNQLKLLEIYSCCELQSVEIQAPGLQKLVLFEINRIRLDNFILDLKIDSQTCKTLRELRLCNSTIRGSTFSCVFSRCTNVESLVLDGCMHFFKIKIASQKLRKLVVTRCFDLLITDINAPNLTSFNLCNYFRVKDGRCDAFEIQAPHLKKISHQQECLLDFSYMLMSKRIWISLWFDKFKDIQGQKMVIYPKSEKYGLIVVEDWSSIAELSLMIKICEAAVKTTITTMNFFDLADYVLESNLGVMNLEKVVTISSTDGSKLYEAIRKKRPEISIKLCSSVAIAKTEVVAALSGMCPLPWFSDESFSSDNNDIDGLSYQALLQNGITRTLKAIRFSIPCLFELL